MGQSQLQRGGAPGPAALKRRFSVSAPRDWRGSTTRSALGRGSTNPMGADRHGSPRALALRHGSPGRAVGPAAASASGGGLGSSAPPVETARGTARVTPPARQQRVGQRRCWRPAPAPSRRGCFCHSRNSRTDGANQLRSGRGGTRVGRRAKALNVLAFSRRRCETASASYGMQRSIRRVPGRFVQNKV